MLAVTCFCAWCQGLTLALVAVWPGLRAPVAGLQRLGRVRGVAAARLVMLVSGGGGCCGLSAVWEIVAEAGAASLCPAGDAGLVAGGEGPPGADLADVGGHQQQRGED